MPKDIKSAFLVLFFGELPHYFNLWAKSCEINHKNFHWFVYNDKLKSKYHFNDAVTMIPYKFDEMVTDFKNILYINISDKKIVCDCRTILYPLRKDKESLDSFDFIGYTDIDLVYGKLNKFLPENMLQYSMISADDERPCGPFTLINRKYIEAVCKDDRIKKRFELSDNKILNGNISPTNISNFAPISNKTCNIKDVVSSGFGHFDESLEFVDIMKEFAPVFCKAAPLQPTMTATINHRKAFAVWENGTITVFDNMFRSKEGAFFHFSRFKNKKRFKIKKDTLNTKKIGIYKYGIVEISSKWKFLKIMLSLYY